MRRLLKRAVVGTRWEGAVKRAHAALTGSKSSLYDAQTIAIMGRVLRFDSTAVDVGAFEGNMLRHMFRFAPKGYHFAFEPLSQRFEQLRVGFPRARVFPYALAAAPGTARFHHVVASPALSGLQRREPLMKGLHIEEVEVKVETLDRVVPDGVPVSFVKVDVEGGELGVFQGGIQTLRNHRPTVVFECGRGGADYFDTQPGDVFDSLANEAKLKISLLGSWLARGQALSRQGFVDQFETGLNYYFVAHP